MKTDRIYRSAPHFRTACYADGVLLRDRYLRKTRSCHIGRARRILSTPPYAASLTHTDQTCRADRRTSPSCSGPGPSHFLFSSSYGAPSISNRGFLYFSKNTQNCLPPTVPPTGPYTAATEKQKRAMENAGVKYETYSVREITRSLVNGF